MLLYLFGATSLTLLLAATPMPLSLRHGGFFIVLFLVCLWIDKAERNENIGSPILKKIKTVLAVIFFSVQLSGALVTHYYDWYYPFSNGKAIADYFQSKGIKGNQVCVYPHFSGPSVSAYLNQNIYYAERNAEGSFANWSIANFEIGSDLLLERCAARQKSTGKPIFIASSISLDTSNSKYTLKKIAQFDGACLQAENYTIYTLNTK